MDSPTSVQYLSAVFRGAWDAYVWSSQFVPHVVLVYAILKLGPSLLPALSPLAGQATLSHPPTISYRGKLQGVSRRLSHPPFHPNAQAMVPTPPSFLGLILWYLSNAVAPVGDVAVSVLSGWTSLVELIKHTCQIPAINSVMTPLGTRLNRGIVQLSTLNAFIPDTPAYRTVFRYFCPASFLLFFFAGLVVVVGMSLELVLLSVGSMLIVATGDMGARAESGADNTPIDSTPGMANVGLIGVLHGEES